MCFLTYYVIVLMLCQVKVSHTHTSLKIYDEILRGTAESILNCNLSGLQWDRASMPISKGGLGVRQAADVALPAFIASIHSASLLSSRVFPRKFDDSCLKKALEVWDHVCGDRPKEKDTCPAKSPGICYGWSNA